MRGILNQPLNRIRSHHTKAAIINQCKESERRRTFIFFLPQGSILGTWGPNPRFLRRGVGCIAAVAIK
jgi:hypothetical protein